MCFISDDYFANFTGYRCDFGYILENEAKTYLKTIIIILFGLFGLLYFSIAAVSFL